MAKLDARRIYQEHLDSASQAAFRGDFEEFLKHVAIPSRVEMADREIVISTSEELELVMQDYALRLQAEGVISERERCIEATFVPNMPDMIAGTSLTEWTFADGRPPRRFANRIVLLRYPDGWKLMWLQSDLACEDLDMISPEFAAAQASILSSLRLQ